MYVFQFNMLCIFITQHSNFQTISGVITTLILASATELIPQWLIVILH